MQNSDKRNRKLNGTITKRIIDLHHKGYHLDFLMLDDEFVLCTQNNVCLPLHAVKIEVIDQGYDQLSRSFKYIHIIDTGNAELGVLLAEKILTTGLTV